jgi:hypothetical protein
MFLLNISIKGCSSVSPNLSVEELGHRVNHAIVLSDVLMSACMTVTFPGQDENLETFRK